MCQFHDIEPVAHGGPSIEDRPICYTRRRARALIGIKPPAGTEAGRLTWISAGGHAVGTEWRMTRNEREPGDPAPSSGEYQELNVFGSPTGRIVRVAQDDALPVSPRGFTWRPLSDYSIDQLRARAGDYRAMADTARTAQVMDSLRKLADRFDALADERERREQDRT